MGEGAVDLPGAHRVKLEGGEMQACAATTDELPLPPGFAEIQAGADAQFSDPERLGRRPARRQSVAVEKDVTAFQPPVAATVNVIATLPGVGHIALLPLEAITGRRGHLLAPGHRRQYH